ncbi:MAG TPA: hypothetical protein PLT26_14480 [Anaerolineaceae bacterium]|nr:hypothetical protein [Anaerolineaceae bacterium]
MDFFVVVHPDSTDELQVLAQAKSLTGPDKSPILFTGKRIVEGQNISNTFTFDTLNCQDAADVWVIWINDLVISVPPRSSGVEACLVMVSNYMRDNKDFLPAWCSFNHHPGYVLIGKRIRKPSEQAFVHLFGHY